MNGSRGGGRPALGEAVQQVARAQRTRLAELLAPHGLHPGQDALLLVLCAEPGLRQAELARRLAVEPPTVTRMVQRLEKAGVVERRADPHDARLSRVYPTARARMLEVAARRAWQEVDLVVERALGRDTSDATVAALVRATAALRPPAGRPGD